MKYGEINVQKIRDVKIPTRSGKDSGYDIYIPNNISDLLILDNCKYTPSDYISDEEQKTLKNSKFIIEDNRIEIPSGYGILIPSGLKFQLPLGNEFSVLDFVLHNKSGIATKTGLLIGACVIDNEYRGELHIHLINTSPFIISINGGQKITQGILRGVSFREINEVDNIDNNTERGEGGFGSTGIS